MALSGNTFEFFESEIKDIFVRASATIIEEEIRKAQDNIRKRINAAITREVMNISQYVTLRDREHEIVITLDKRKQ
jgi:hypothetical protein